MNRNDAKKIAETITNEELAEMLNNAKNKITDWSKTSSVNKGMTLGTSWNILGFDFDATKKHHILYKINLVREFGEFLSNDTKPKKKIKRQSHNPVHQEPKFK